MFRSASSNWAFGVEFGDCWNCGTDVRFDADDEAVRILHPVMPDVHGEPLCFGCYREFSEYEYEFSDCEYEF